MPFLVVSTVTLLAGPDNPATATKTPTPKAEEATLIPSAGDGAKFWPRFRGTTGQGHVKGTDYPTH